MKDFFLKRQLERIEREGNDDFLMILSFGARSYPTKELHQLLCQLEQKMQQLAYYRRLLYLAGSTFIVWCALSFLFQYSEFKVGTYATMSLAILTILVFTAGSIFINSRYRSVRQAHQIERIIVEEIDRRRKDASIF
jgi:hypothetical protein